MSGNASRDIEEIFHGALARPPRERDGFLDDACGDDAAARAEIESLLAHHAASSEFLETPAVESELGPGAQTSQSSPTSRTGEPLPPDQRFGDYRIIRVLGDGGMGIVYLAEQEHPRRLVALKVIQPGFATRDMLRRFEHETELLARLQHPGVAQIYEASTTRPDSAEDRSPQPYFAMEYIDGQPLLDYAREHDFDMRARLDLLARICDAVHHAHQKGVIHRDLKPANILVDPTGQPKILDFGIARAIDADIRRTTMRTSVGQIIGTLPYMSPEQASGDPTQLDIRSDVYALGVLCFELLTGRLPYDLDRRMIHEAVHIIRDGPPRSISTIDRALRGDVETIVAKALAKEKERRYQSASDLAADLRRYLNDEPIAARPTSAVHHLRMFARRNRMLVGGTVAVFLALLIGIIGVSWQWRRATAAEQRAVNLAQSEAEQRTLAEQRLAEAERRERQMRQIADFQASMFRGLNPARLGGQLRDDILQAFRDAGTRAGRRDEEIARDVEALEQLLDPVNFTDVTLRSLDRTVFERVVRASPRVLADQPVVEGYLLQTIAHAYDDLGLYEQALPVQQRALARLREGLGDDAGYTIGAIMSTGVVLWHLDRLDEAAAHFEEAFERADRVLGPDNPRTLKALGNLAMIADERGRTAESIELTRDQLERVGRVRGETHPDVLPGHINLGEMLVRVERYDEAEHHFRRALEIARDTLGRDDPITIIALIDLGVLLQATGRVESSLGPLTAAAERAERVLGNRHPYTLSALLALADTLEALGRRDDLIRTLRHAMQIHAALAGANDPETEALRERLERAKAAGN
jgi:serine/threonine protein kinase